MPARSGFQHSFKTNLLRRLGSWGSSLSVDEFDKLFVWAAKLVPNQDIRNQAERLHHGLTSGDCASEIIRRFFDLDQHHRQRFIENMMVNWGVIGGARRYEVLDQEGWFPPAFAVISPTMRCNLRCKGCYAFEYRRAGELTTEEFDSTIRQCKDLGVYFFTISGGEPFVRDDLLEMIGRHDDCFFQIYTNGTAIDDHVADRLLELGNATPAISVEGFGDETDARRGAGTFERVLATMDLLKERKLLFGISATVTRHNHDLLMSDKFYDFYCDRGAHYAWFFQYIPIGREPNVDLMSTPEQRAEFRHRLVEIRDEKPIFIGDFWNDGVHAGGCMAGGRLYFHVTSNGNVEPCVFCHFTIGNIREKPLKEILSCDFFKAIRHEQPYSRYKNLYTPCMIIDNPEVLRRLTREFGARPSHEGAETIIEDPRIVAHLDKYAARMQEISEPEWIRDHYENPDSEWYRSGFRMLRQWALEREQLDRWARERSRARGQQRGSSAEESAGELEEMDIRA
jgi:MoaA/NifB/PqqE/SkfB family radical SAM enzyme